MSLCDVGGPQEDRITETPTVDGASPWPSHYQAIKRIRCEDPKQLVELLKPFVEKPEPVVVEGSGIINVDKWRDMSYLVGLIGERKVRCKRSPNGVFRFFKEEWAQADHSKHFGWEFPVEEYWPTFKSFLEESQRLHNEASPQRLYVQEGLENHTDMSDEFGSWDWPTLLLVCKSFGWGLPESNNLYVGMTGSTSPLHYDELENMYFQIRGRKEVCLFPWTDRPIMYAFPCRHPCDRQSMVGNPVKPDLDAFPRFAEARGHTAMLREGDLLYMPYGWWHWFRNVDHHATSISCWCKTLPEDPAKIMREGWHGKAYMHLLRNLEGRVTDEFGLDGLDDLMTGMKEAVLGKRGNNAALQSVRNTLCAAGIDDTDRQDAIVLEMLDGRFGGVPWQHYVNGDGGWAAKAKAAEV